MILHPRRIVLRNRENVHARTPARKATEAISTPNNGGTLIDFGASAKQLIQLFETSIKLKELIFGSNIRSLRALDPLGF